MKIFSLFMNVFDIKEFQYILKTFYNYLIHTNTNLYTNTKFNFNTDIILVLTNNNKSADKL